MGSDPPQKLGPARLVAVLAGGASSRMGTPKPALALAGAPLIDYPVAAARAAGLAPFVVAKKESVLPPLDCPLVHEPEQPRHPLTGIVAALEHAGEPLVVLPCDAPLLPPGLIAALAARESSFAMPREPRPQPLVARYSPALLEQLREALAESTSMIALAEQLGGDRLGGAELRALGDPRRMFANVNDPASLARVEAELERSGGVI